MDAFYASSQMQTLPKSPLGLWLRLNKLGFFESTWERKDTKQLDGTRHRWQPHADQWKWFDWVLEQEGAFLFMGARNMGKTEILLIFQCVWLLTQDPQYRIMIITGTAERSKELVKHIRFMLQKLGVPLVGKSLSLVRLAGNKSWQDNVLYAGVNSNIKGNTCDLTIIDDPLDTKEGPSEKKRARLRQVVNESTIQSERLLIIGQYIHEQDPMREWEQNVPTFRAWIGEYSHICPMTKEQFLIGGNMRFWGMQYEGVFYDEKEEAYKSRDGKRSMLKHKTQYEE